MSVAADTREHSVLDRVRSIVAEALAGQPAEVYLFGSWATGRQRRSSDIDVAIEPKGALATGTLARVREALEESTVPYRVDVADLSQCAPDFRQRVRHEGIKWTASTNA